MIYNDSMNNYRKNSIGISVKASKMEDEAGLNKTKFLSVLTLQEIADFIGAYYNAPEITVVASKQLGTGNRAICRGKFIYGSNGWHIRISTEKGMLISTILHEMGHFIDFTKRGISSHERAFQIQHEEILDIWIDTKQILLPRYVRSDELNFYWERFPKVYEANNIGNITEDELLIKLREKLNSVWDFKRQTETEKQEVSDATEQKPLPNMFQTSRGIQKPNLENPLDMFRRLRNE